MKRKTSKRCGNVVSIGMKVAEQFVWVAGISADDERARQYEVNSLAELIDQEIAASKSTTTAAPEKAKLTTSPDSILDRRRARLGDSIVAALAKAGIDGSHKNGHAVLKYLTGCPAPYTVIAICNLEEIIDWDDRLRRTTITRLREIVNGAEAGE